MRSANGERDLERIRYVAANYEHLQGLKRLPLGIFLLALVSAIGLSLAWTEARGGMLPGAYVLGAVALIFALFVAGIALPHFISAHYERRYGTVQRYRPMPRKRKVLYAAMALALFFGGSLPLLAMGVAMVVAYWPERRFQGHYVVIGAADIGVFLAHTMSVLPYPSASAWIWPSGAMLSGVPSMSILISVAAYLIVGGLLDHLLLVRTMRTAPEEGDAGAV